MTAEDIDAGSPSTASMDSVKVAPSIERHHLVTVLRQINDLHHCGQVDPQSALREINQTSVVSVPGAMYAGITAVDDAGQLSTLGATHPFPEALDNIQREADEGPGLCAAWNQHTIHIDDLTTDSRWPTYRDLALQRTPVRTVISFRLFTDGRRMAALNLYADTPGVFDDQSLETGLIYAAHTSLACNTVLREQQFRSALASRDVIGQAKGMLMERFQIDAHAAFELLRRLSQTTNTKLFEIADKLTTLDRTAPTEGEQR